MFFSQIKETFGNQTKKENFEIINNHYKDKTFSFNINNIYENTNCFLSKDHSQNFNYIKDLKLSEWIKAWEKNNYQKFQSFDIRKIDLDLSFKVLGNFDDTKNIQIDDWKKNYNNIIKNIKNEELLEKYFLEIFESRLSQKYRNKSLYLKEIGDMFDYKSISKLKRNFKIFVNKINCTNVEQGLLGTCYILETISILSNYGQLLYQLFPKENIKKEGFYEICLFHEGRWVKVLVDDYFVFRKNTDDFAFCEPINDCLYSCFLEKAYAKINGSYADINGGNLRIAFEALTGFNSFSIKKHQLNEQIYNNIYDKIENGYLFSCKTENHAYSIISILKKENDKIFHIRNPWASLPEKELKLYNTFLEKYPEYKIERSK